MTKTFVNDAIHGNIALTKTAVAIIDTEHFQRLRNIKQLGPCHWVFPGATHTRFEHCIGTYHLAGLLFDSLKANASIASASSIPQWDSTEAGKSLTFEECFSEKWKECVQIAGLCHDLGHGPFSHSFEKFVKTCSDDNWSHEGASVALLKDLVLKYAIQMEECQIELISQLILGIPSMQSSSEPGLSKVPLFLFDIVSNKRNSLDVDKLDYINRDCYFLGVRKSFNLMR